jgi:GWxTD domain-containing protein
MRYLLLFLLASNLFAADDPRSFARGPLRWLMTKEEEKAFRAAKGVDAAQKFVDLFWARRDPTPGTLQNEYRDEIAGRVAFADKNFTEGQTRGSLTERGRVLIVLGYPSNMGNEAAKYEKQQSTDANDFTGGRRLAGRDVWTWTHADALKYEMPKIEVVFLIDPMDFKSHRDPQRPDFITALPVAIKKSIVSPDLTEVPAWARPGFTTAPSNVVLTVETTETTPAVTTTTAPAPAPVPRKPIEARPKGAGKLTLVRDAFALEAQTKKDPFDGLASLDQFKRGQELGFVAEYCAGVIAEELTGVTVQTKLSGIANGQKVNMSGPPDELIPDSIKVSPGCHLVRGSLPLEGVDPGQYTLSLTIVAGQDKYNLTREFRVE